VFSLPSSSPRLWKWLASSSPRLWNCLCNRVLRFVQLRLTVYGNGWQAVFPFMETVLEVVRAKTSGYIKS
jgi:hypothetical protein